MSHDSCNSWICVSAKCKRLGYPETCETCRGESELWDSPEAKAAYEAWEQEEPPAGDGFQLWQNTSEGSPVSPVFNTLAKLCAWCEKNATTFGDSRATAEQWREMLDADFVCHKEGGVVFI